MTVFLYTVIKTEECAKESVSEETVKMLFGNEIHRLRYINKYG